MARLLIIDDEEAICWGLSRLAVQAGHQAVTAASAEQALGAAAVPPPELIILDVRLPGMDGLTAMRHFQSRWPQVPIIVMTAYGDLETAVQAVRQGAAEYIIKPFDMQQISAAMNRALTAPPKPASAAESGTPVAGFVGSSPAMQQVYNQIALATTSEVPVLLCGESGVGKELAARAIHRYSRRASGPFVVANLAALSPTLAESELFGHVRGAFTGADQSRTGLLVQADQGTLFLDEVAEIPLATQVKLLRTLEHGEVYPVGADKPVATNFRLVSATHRDLPALVGQGQFRHDLYFRLAVFTLTLPPLRERKEDILSLAQFFLAEGQTGPVPGLSEETHQILLERPWYGNVRELRNAIQHARLKARGGPVLQEHLPPPVTFEPTQAPPQGATFEDQLRRWILEKLQQPEANLTALYEELLGVVEPVLFSAVLAHTAGSASAASRILGLHRTTVRRKIDQYGLDAKNDDTPGTT